MILTGIADEAGDLLKTQIEATKALGWENIEARNVQIEGFEKSNLHDISEEAFDKAAELLEASGVKIYAFGSTIANWGKKIDEPFDTSEVERAIPRMKRLGTKFVRIMSYAIRDDEDQMADERIKRVSEITKRFLDEGLQPVHENCMNYGGMSYHNTLELLEKVPGLKLVFDTANPVFNPDYSKPEPRPRQDPWEFWRNVREHVVHIHIKDCIWNHDKNDATYTFPGEGQAKVKEILTDAFQRGYDAGISIEPHMAVVFHDASVTADPKAQFDNYVQYGQKMMALINDIKSAL